MRNLYICHTIYHLYITIIKKLINNQDIDIVLSDTIYNCVELKEKLLKFNISDNIFIIEESKIKLPARGLSVYDKINHNKKIAGVLSKYIEFEPNNYDHIYIYNDSTKIGMYLISNKLEYKLIEDGLNSFKNIDKLWYKKYSFKSKVLGYLNLNILFWGESKYCKSIEVNEIKDLKIPLKKVIELDRGNLIKKLSNENKKIIWDIFVKSDTLEEVINEKSIIILTQPLFQDNLVKSESYQKNLYKTIIDKYSNSNSNIIIKPHPRDKVEYNFENCTIMDKMIPIEALNFNKNIKVDKVITVFSTAIDAIEFANEKINLGFEYINENVS